MLSFSCVVSYYRYVCIFLCDPFFFAIDMKIDQLCFHAACAIFVMIKIV